MKIPNIFKLDTQDSIAEVLIGIITIIALGLLSLCVWGIVEWCIQDGVLTILQHLGLLLLVGIGLCVGVYLLIIILKIVGKCAMYLWDLPNLIKKKRRIRYYKKEAKRLQKEFEEKSKDNDLYLDGDKKVIFNKVLHYDYNNYITIDFYWDADDKIGWSADIDRFEWKPKENKDE